MGVISGSLDDNIQIRNVGTHAKLEDVLQEHSSEVIYVSETADLRHIVSTYHKENAMIWNHESTAIAKKSAYKHVLKNQNRE